MAQAAYFAAVLQEGRYFLLNSFPISGELECETGKWNGKEKTPLGFEKGSLRKRRR
jgi:hypothetical protein